MPEESQQSIVWIAIALCVTQSAMFSGCNLAFYRLSRLRLEVEAHRDPRAERVLRLREDSNFLLATILWGNVAINVLLALLANSVLLGVLAPVVRCYQFLLYPVAKPTARFLDWWLGREAIEYMHEPRLALNVNDFTRAALYGRKPLDPYEHCHRPILVRDRHTTLGDVIRRLKRGTRQEGDVIDNDLVLIWLEERRIITGSDILGRLLTGIGNSQYL